MRCAVAIVVVALSASRLLAEPVQEPPFEPERTAEAGATLEVKVVCADGAKVPDEVEVRVVAAPEHDALPSRRELGARLARAKPGSRRRAVAGDAIFDVTRPDGPLVVVASAPGLYAEDVVDEVENGPIEVALRPDRSFAVRVVDERGHPVPGVPVTIAAFDTWDSLPDVLLDRATRFPVDPVIGDRDGIARFDHFNVWMHPDSQTDSIALLAVPHREHEQIRVTPTLLESGTLELRAPPFGTVELRFPGVDDATVRLRERPAPLDPEGEYEHLLGPGDWRREEPLELAVVDGVARCDRVGIGCQLELEARWRGLATPFLAELAGPSCAGETVEWTLAAGSGSPGDRVATVTGRAFDGAHRPLAASLLHGRIVTWHREESEDGQLADADWSVDPNRSEEFTFTTDAAGAFSLRLGVRVDAPHFERWLAIEELAGSDEAKARGARGWIALDGRLGAGAHDLGVVRLVGSDSKSALGRLRDDALIAECEAAQAWPRQSPFRIRTIHRRLNEMARRGGSRMVSFLELQIARLRDQATRAHEAEVAENKAARARAKAAASENGEEQLPPPIADEPWSFAVELKWAALLRRAERKPAPITVEAGSPESVSVSPESPEVKVTVRDADRGFEGVSVPKLDAPGWRVTVFDRDGRTVPEPEWAFMVNGVSWPIPDPCLQFDDTIVEVVPLGRRLESARPGDYRVRLEYLIDDVVYVSSGDLPIRVRPIPIRVSRRDYDAMVEWIRSIDASKSVLLTLQPTDPAGPFTGAPESPEDRIARCGIAALPALLDELDETTGHPRRRAWILGLLWNLHQATTISSDQIEAATGSFVWRRYWPTLLPNGDDSTPSGLNPGRRPNDPADIAPDPRVQRDLAAMWTENRGWFEFTIED